MTVKYTSLPQVDEGTLATFINIFLFWLFKMYISSQEKIKHPGMQQLNLAAFFVVTMFCYAFFKDLMPVSSTNSPCICFILLESNVTKVKSVC